MTYLSGRVATLERKQAIKAGHVEEPLSQHFAVSSSCPPDTRIHIRGGNLWEGSWWVGVGSGYYIEAQACDFSDPSAIENYDGSFVNAGYYLGLILTLAIYGLEDLEIVGGGVEYATATEAEQYITTTALSSAPWYEKFPLCGLVLRNNGDVGVDGAILPIDRINRGRSYLWLV